MVGWWDSGIYKFIDVVHVMWVCDGGSKYGYGAIGYLFVLCIVNMEWI